MAMVVAVIDCINRIGSTNQTYESMLNNALLQQLSQQQSLSPLTSQHNMISLPPPPPPPPPPSSTNGNANQTANGMATVQCLSCTTQLSYPTGKLVTDGDRWLDGCMHARLDMIDDGIYMCVRTGSAFIQCPKCSNTMNPQQPNTNYMNCIGCNTLLSHPPSSVQIQCPKCYVIMEVLSFSSFFLSSKKTSLPHQW
jgi:LSD1 subclass zinc finger protein